MKRLLLLKLITTILIAKRIKYSNLARCYEDLTEFFKYEMREVEREVFNEVE